ncbi:succinate dehydrogenase cytochrome b subunit [Labedaea rhizosphaerae]|uniref:Succinate dehydrogenase / fumarate reductase cytochrome b subunit n=1 Tax=Labedaea rhizosphaerae TaxID=598644 RepID=A0A4R6SFW8_LABRH|nr:succinate dehydrogenase cytochrome b subunit [Labedaea rhizosphaerae]TDP98095.1 succinate dehydrogenase / fumarate reductase cytochrome b subunit [Labedaea rhizosphaerae]
MATFTAPRLWSSTVGKKAVMAVTGVVLLLYVVAHMAANLKIFVGPESLDGYGRWLRGLGAGAFGYGGLIWIARVVLVAAVVLHMTAAVQLARRAHAARPVAYQVRPRVHGSYAARTMRWGGVLIALFVVYHVLDITTGTVNPHGVPGEDYANVVASFQRWYVVLFYLFAVVALGLHLRHGAASALRSLGSARAVQPVAVGLAVLVTAGFAVVPLSVYFGLVK